MQDGLVSTDHQCMTGIVTALKTDNRLCAIGEQVDDLSLSFVAPVGTDNDYVLAHSCSGIRNVYPGREPAGMTSHRPARFSRTRSQPISRAPPICPGSSQTTRSP